MAALLSAISKLLSSLGFAVKGMLLAETAILLHLKTVRRVFLVLLLVVVALLALRAGQGDLDSHCSAPPLSVNKPPSRLQAPLKKGIKNKPAKEVLS